MSTSVDTRRYGFYSTAPQWVLAPDDPRHGTVNGYNNLKCRCDPCKAAWSAYMKRHRDNCQSNPVPEHVHGTANGYHNYKCKCPDCLTAGREDNRKRYKPSPARALSRAKTEAIYADFHAGMSIEELAQKWELSTNAIYCRLHDAGLSLRSVRKQQRRQRATGMYVDYCTGMSTAEVAEKWGVTPAYVTRVFGELGVPLRPSRGVASRVVPVPAGVPWEQANQRRTETAAARRIEQAKAAQIRNVPMPLVHHKVLNLRIAHPDKSLAELAALCDPPMTKDAYASHLRRALANAEAS